MICRFALKKCVVYHQHIDSVRVRGGKSCSFLWAAPMAGRARGLNYPSPAGAAIKGLVTICVGTSEKVPRQRQHWQRNNTEQQRLLRNTSTTDKIVLSGGGRGWRAYNFARNFRLMTNRTASESNLREHFDIGVPCSFKGGTVPRCPPPPFPRFAA